MATSKVSVTEGSGKNLATYQITEDAVLKEIQRISLVDNTGSEISPATQATLAAVLAKIIVAPSTEAKQDVLIAKDFATQTTLAAILAKIIAAPATEATLALIKAKTDNLDVLLSTRTKPSDTQPVSGTVAISNFPATQPVSASTLPLPTGAATSANQTTELASLSSIDTKTPVLGQALAAASTPVVLTAAQITTLTPQTNALTDAQLRATSVPVTIPQAVNSQSSLIVTATGISGAAVTATIPAGGAGLFAYIASVEITAYNAVARVGGATPVIVTTTNITNSPAFTFGSAGSIGVTDSKLYIYDNPLKTTTANTATTIVCPATTSVIWRINVTYFYL